ncbi:MAG: hypothetical protein LQ340_005591, partial [Diploschistes diacapsis]
MTLLGKRKRRASLQATSPPPQPNSDSDSRFRALLQKHFEATYAPLPTLSTPQKNPDESSDDGGEDSSTSTSSEPSDWSGLSDRSTAEVEVIEHSGASGDMDSGCAETSKLERKAFMTCKPPPHASASASHPAKNTPSSTAAPLANSASASAAALAANDLALHRLLTESHLLSANPASSLNPNPNSTLSLSLNPSLSARHAATDLRLLSLGAKTPLKALAQKTMPLAHR